MQKPTIVLAALAVLALVAAPAARAAHPTSYDARKKLQRLAHEVADAAREVYRSAAGRHGHPRFWNRGRGHGHGRHGGYDDHALRLVADLEHRARDLERALDHRPVVHTHREFEALVRAFNHTADAFYRQRVSPAAARDFEHLAEHMYALDGYYQDVAYARRARYRSYDRRYGGRVEVYGPRWNVEWRRYGWPRHDDWDSDSDSDSY